MAEGFDDRALAGLGAASLAIPLPDPYVVRHWAKRAVLRALDFLGRRPKTVPVDWGRIKRLAVLRLDHMGDLVLALPSLKALKAAWPGVELHLWVGPWAREAAQMARVADKVMVFEAPWFRRPQPRAFDLFALRRLTRALKEQNYDLGADPRGDARHLLALEMAGIPQRAGLTLTGGGFLLTHPLTFKPGLHESDQGFRFWEQLGLKIRRPAAGALLFPGREGEKQARAAWQSLKLKGKVAALHVTCGAQARFWQPERWAALIDRLAASSQVVLLGTQSEAAAVEDIAARCRKRPKLATGKFGLAGLTAFLRRCQVLVSLNSGPAHLAAAVGTPVVELFAATDLAWRWAAKGPKVKVIQKKVPCLPCQLERCPFGNECMRRISAEEAARAAESFLRGHN